MKGLKWLHPPWGTYRQYLICLVLILYVIFPGELITTTENCYWVHLIPYSGYRLKHSISHLVYIYEWFGWSSEIHISFRRGLDLFSTCTVHHLGTTKFLHLGIHISKLIYMKLSWINKNLFIQNEIYNSLKGQSHEIFRVFLSRVQ